MAGGRRTFETRAPSPGIVVVAGRIDNSHNIVDGKGFSVSDPGTGRYKITLSHHYPACYSATGTLKVNGSGNVKDLVVQVTDVSVGSGNKTVEFAVLDPDTTTLTDLSASEELHFCLILKDTTAS